MRAALLHGAGRVQVPGRMHPPESPPVTSNAEKCRSYRERKATRVTANLARTESKVRPGRPAIRDRVAPDMVRGWDQAQRKRIRGILLLALLLCYPLGTDLAGTPEMRVVAMIDKEQACRPR